MITDNPIRPQATIEVMFRIFSFNNFYNKHFTLIMHAFNLYLTEKYIKVTNLFVPNDLH